GALRGGPGPRSRIGEYCGRAWVAEKDRGLKPATKSAAVITAAQSKGALTVSLDSERRILGRPGLAARFIGSFWRERRLIARRLDSSLLGVILPLGGFPLAGWCMRGFFLRGIKRGLGSLLGAFRGAFAGSLVLLRRESRRALLAAIPCFSHQPIFGSGRRQQRPDDRAHRDSHACQDQGLLA